MVCSVSEVTMLRPAGEDNVRPVSVSPPRTLCLGDALVDLVGERAGAQLTEVDRFSPHLGGAAANVALVAAQAGAHISLAGGAGEPSYHLHGERPELIVRAVGSSERSRTRPACSSPPTPWSAPPSGR